MNFAVTTTEFHIFVQKKVYMINREIYNSILADFKRKKVIVLLGARQVGKTTLLEGLSSKEKKCLFLNCDNLDDKVL